MPTSAESSQLTWHVQPHVQPHAQSIQHPPASLIVAKINVLIIGMVYASASVLLA